MSTEILLTLAAIIIAVLIYFAGVVRGKSYRAEDYEVRKQEQVEAREQRLKEEKDKRIKEVVDRYRGEVTSRKSSGFTGMLQSGVLTLRSSEEIGEVCSIIKNEGLTPGIPQSHADSLKGLDLQKFFKRLSQKKSVDIGGEADKIIRELKEESNR